jgi:hypothetical protein
MDPRVHAALQAIDEAVEAVREEMRREPLFPITPQHAADVAAMMAWPENQDGAVKDGIWATYVWCYEHFRSARLVR